MEEKLQALEQDRGSDRPSDERIGSTEGRAAAFIPAQAGLQSHAAAMPERSVDKGDVVDGMASVALTDGADEHEYFGKSLRLQDSCEYTSQVCKLMTSCPMTNNRRLIQSGILKGHRPRRWEPGGPSTVAVCYGHSRRAGRQRARRISEAALQHRHLRREDANGRGRPVCPPAP